MALFQKLSKKFSSEQPTNSGEREQVINETKKRSRLIQDNQWIRNQSDESSKVPVDENYGKIALNQVKTEESVNRYSSGTNKLPTEKYDTFDGSKRDSGSTQVTSPTNKYSSLDRNNRTYEIKKDDLPKMTIITSDTKIESPTSKSPQSRPSPDGQVTKTFSKTSTKKEPAPLIDLTPTTDKPTKGSSNFMSRFGSKSLINLSTDPEKTHESTPDTTSNTPEKTASLIDLTSNDPSKDKRSSGKWDTPYSTTTSTFDPTSTKSRSREDWENPNPHTTTSSKTTFNPTARSSSNNDWEITTTTKTTTKTTFDPEIKASSTNKGDLDTNSYNWTNTKKTFAPDSRDTRSTSEQDLFDEPTSKTRTSKTFSYNSSKDKSPDIEEKQNSPRFSYKENSPPNVPPFDNDEYPSYESSKYSLPRSKNSSSSLSDGKSPAKVITLTTAYTSAEQITKDKNLCTQCFKPFNGDPKMVLKDLNINCHASCLKCQICHKSLENLTAGDCIWVHLNTVHCENCFDNVMARLEF